MVFTNNSYDMSIDVVHTMGSRFTIAPDCLGEAAFLDRDNTVWEVYMANPFVDAPAMTDLFEPRIGKVRTPMVEMWLDRARSTQLELTCCLSS